jgi:hypothetical protein
MLVGAWITQAIYVAAELGIADLLGTSPRTAEELAERVGAHGNSLYRVLRALASVGIFAEDDAGRFSLTPLAEHLRSDVQDVHRSFAIMTGAEFYASWGNLLFSAQTGKEAFRKTFGVSFFEYMTEHPDRHRIYDCAMEGFTVAENEPMLDAYDFSRFKTVVDVGGGNGAVLARNPQTPSGNQGNPIRLACRGGPNPDQFSPFGTGRSMSNCRRRFLLFGSFGSRCIRAPARYSRLER